MSAEAQGPPLGERPVALSLGVVLAHTDAVAVHIAGAYAYSTGLTFGVAMVSRSGDGLQGRDADSLARPAGEDDAHMGVVFADGRRATPDTEPRGPEAPSILLGARGGGGDASAYETRMWLWPIPPEGPLTFAFRWLAEGIEETTVAIDAAPLREASARTAVWWPEGS
jgi:hypothetical protein